MSHSGERPADGAGGLSVDVLAEKEARNAARRLLATEDEICRLPSNLRDWFMSKPGHRDAFDLARFVMAKLGIEAKDACGSLSRMARETREEKRMDENQLGSAPIEESYRAQMNAVARTLDEVFNGDAKGPSRQVGFVLLVFPFGEKEGRCNYISNGADRRDMVKLLREQANRFDTGTQ